MNLKEIIITTIVICIIEGMYCILLTFIFLFSENLFAWLALITILTAIFGPICLIIVSKVIKKNPPFLASERKNVGISPFDCFTWGHIAFGILSFIVELFFIIFFSLEDGFLLWWDLMLTIVLIAISWDIIENTLFIQVGIKFENRRDSIINIFSDVFFVAVGGGLMILVYLLTQLSFFITLIVGIALLAACILFFFIFYRKINSKREAR